MNTRILIPTHPLIQRDVIFVIPPQSDELVARFSLVMQVQTLLAFELYLIYLVDSTVLGVIFSTRFHVMNVNLLGTKQSVL
jgi:hypothetical protein